MEYLNHFFHFIEWIKSYKKAFLIKDLSAGITVAIMLVPQAMGYAMLAGLSPVTGLYAASLPLLGYALLGSSRHLAVGPVAMVSLLVFSTVSGMAAPGSKEYVELVLLLTLIVGGIQILLGLFRIGFIVNFFSHAVISGFTSAAAIIIGVSQLGHLIGVKLEGNNFLAIIFSFFTNVTSMNLPTLLISLASIFLFVLFKKIKSHFPAGILAVVIFALLVYLFRLDKTGVSITGHVPGGFPLFVLPVININKIPALLPAAFTIVFVGFLESIAIAQSIAAREKYKIKPDNELKGLGIANILAAFFSGYPVTGGLSRTAVNHQGGAKTPLASIITAVLIILTLLFLTPLFYFLPKAVLASIIVVAVAGLVDYKEGIQLFKLNVTDGLIVILTFLVTLLVGIEQGIITGVIVSLLLFIWKSANPGIIELGYVDIKKAFLNIKRFPEAKTFPHILILRIDGPLFFANTRFVEDFLRMSLANHMDIASVILEMSGVNNVDGESLLNIKEIVNQYSSHKIQFIFTGMKGVVRDLFLRAKWEQTNNQKIEYKTIQQALAELNIPISE